MNSCPVIADVLPLYVEDMVSNETRSFVNEHLATCEACKQMSVEMQTESEEEDLQPSEGAQGLKQVRAAIAKDHWLVSGLSTLVSLIVGLLFISYIATPTLVAYDNLSDVLRIKEAAGKVSVVYPDNFALDLNGSDGHYTVGLSQSLIQRQNPSVGDITVTVNPAGEPVQTIVYELNERGAYTMLYENKAVEQGIVHGGIETLPRMSLAVRMQFVMIALVLLLVLVGVWAKTRSWKHVLVFAGLLPVSLVIGTAFLYLVNATISFAPIATVCIYFVLSFLYAVFVRRRTTSL